MPGAPSTITKSSLCFAATRRTFARTVVTSFPEFSSAIPSRAWTIGPVTDTRTHDQMKVRGIDIESESAALRDSAAKDAARMSIF